MTAVASTDLQIRIERSGVEIIVTIGLEPGITRKDISLTLIDPQALRFSCEYPKKGARTRQAQRTLTRVIFLPEKVTDDGASALIRNGDLEIRLKTAIGSPERNIPVGKEIGTFDTAMDEHQADPPGS